MRNRSQVKDHNYILRQLTDLHKMSAEELKMKWLALYGTKAPDFRPSFMVKRLAYRIQELYYGGLSDEVVRKLEFVAANDPLVKNPSGGVGAAVPGRKPLKPGTRLIRDWHGKRYEVTVRKHGFEYGGRVFNSLTSLATQITGSKRSGNVFFGLSASINEKE